jgi:hypothetical protein
VECPIEVSDAVLDEAGQPPERFDLDGDPGETGATGEPDDFDEFGGR